MSQSLFSLFLGLAFVVASTSAHADRRRYDDRDEAKDIGTVIGAVIGGGVAAATGGNTGEILLGTGIGALGGNIVGDAIDDENDRQDAYNRGYNRSYDRYDRGHGRRGRSVRRARSYNRIQYDCFPYRYGPYPNQVGFVVVHVRSRQPMHQLYYDQMSCVHYARQLNRYGY